MASPNDTEIQVPFSRKVVVGLIAAAVGAVLPLIGVYEVPAYLQGFISTAEYGLAAFVVTEQERYLLPALSRVRALSAKNVPPEPPAPPAA